MKVIFFSVFSLFFFTSVFAEKKQINIVGDSYPPYSYLENGEYKGTDVDTIRAVFSKLDIEPVFKFRPWARAMSEVKSGESDAIYSLFKTKEREAFLDYPIEPLNYEKNILVVNGNSDKTAQSIEDIKGWTIGVVTKNSYGVTFDEYQDIERVESVNNERLVLQLNAKNRLDAIIINELLFDATVNNFVTKGEFKKPNFRKLDYVPNIAPLYIGFSKKSGIQHALFAQKFSDAMAQLNNEGVVQRIIGSYTNRTTSKVTTAVSE